jgi:hypothetical protein
MKNPSKLNLIFTLLVIILTCSNLIAQDYKVKDLDTFVPEYNDKHKIILRAIEASTEPLAVKLKMYEDEMKKLKATFKKDRISEYSSKATSLSVYHSCTSKSRGGKKKCGWRTVWAPTPEMYTNMDMVSVDGDTKGTVVSPDGRAASIKMSVAGEGKNSGTLTAIFKYHPDRMQIKVSEEIDTLFNIISQS